jgi:hypothetical protein
VSYPDSDITKTASKKVANHLWYLSEYLAGLVGLDVKSMIVGALNKEGQEYPSLRAHVDLAAKEVIVTMTVADFVTSTSPRIFAEFNVNIDFLENDPVEWEGDPFYQSSHQVVRGIAVINDFAERRVALIEDYSLVLTKDEQQRQYLLQVVEWHYRQHNCSNSS